MYEAMTYRVENQQIGLLSTFNIFGTKGYIEKISTDNAINLLCCLCEILFTSTLRKGMNNGKDKKSNL